MYRYVCMHMYIYAYIYTYCTIYSLYSITYMLYRNTMYMLHMRNTHTISLTLCVRQGAPHSLPERAV